MPSLIAVRGPIGAGKSTIVRAVAEGLPDCTALETDAIKRLIDPTASSKWRRDVAETATYGISMGLLRHGRSVVAETHSRWPHQTERLRVAAWRVPSSHFFSFLVTAPFDVCLERARERVVPDITYPIDEAMIRAYYTGLEPLQDELKIDTSVESAQAAAKIIIENVLHYTKQTEG